jgi:hypothetical protein
MAPSSPVRTYQELLSDDPVLPLLQRSAREAKNHVEILPPPDPASRERGLVELQVTTRSMIGGLVHDTGGILVDHGYLRHLGGGSARLPRVLGAWNAAIEVPMHHFMVVADDVLGGVFAINGGPLGENRGGIHYYAPDSLQWESLDCGHSDFVFWTFDANLASFYEGARWPGWQEAISGLPGDHVLSCAPPLFTKEGRDLARVDRRPVPAGDHWRAYGMSFDEEP